MALIDTTDGSQPRQSENQAVAPNRTTTGLQYCKYSSANDKKPSSDVFLSESIGAGVEVKISIEIKSDAKKDKP